MSYIPIYLDHLNAEDLTRLLAAENVPWTSRDGVSALMHQLSAPLFIDLLTLPGMTAESLRAMFGDFDGSESFFQFLTARNPTLQGLEVIKQFGRHYRGIPESPLCGQPAAVVYYAAIAAARWALDQKISRIPDADLKAAFEWASTYEGAESLDAVFRGALRKIGETQLGIGSADRADTK